MKFIQNSLICVLLISLALMTGCAKPPTEEMNKAEDAVARAENDPDAVNYAGNLVSRAKDSLSLMHQEADAKRYDSAITHANSAVSLAERAISEGRAEAQRARDQASTLLSALKPEILETEHRIDKAKADKLPVDFEAIDNDFNTAQMSYDQAQSAMSSNRYKTAIALCYNVRVSLNDIDQKLGVTAMEVSRKK